MSVCRWASNRRALDAISIVADTSTSFERCRFSSVVLHPVMSSDWMYESWLHMHTRVGCPASSSRLRRRVRPSSSEQVVVGVAGHAGDLGDAARCVLLQSHATERVGQHLDADPIAAAHHLRRP